MSFINKIKSSGKRSSGNGRDLPFDEASRAQGLPMPGRSGAAAMNGHAPTIVTDTSIISEAAPTEIPGDFAETRMQDGADGAGSHAKLPLIGHLPAAKQQRVLGAMTVLGLIGLLGIVGVSQTNANNVAAQVGASGQSLMQSQRLAKSVSQALIGSPAAFPEVKDSVTSLARDVRGLHNGSAELQAASKDVQAVLEPIIPSRMVLPASFSSLPSASRSQSTQPPWPRCSTQRRSWRRGSPSGGRRRNRWTRCSPRSPPTPRRCGRARDAGRHGSRRASLVADARRLIEEDGSRRDPDGVPPLPETGEVVNIGLRCSPTPSPARASTWSTSIGGSPPVVIPMSSPRSPGSTDRRGDHRRGQRRGRPAPRHRCAQGRRRPARRRVVPGFEGRTLLHCGPPIDYADAVDPLRRSMRAAVVAEGWADRRRRRRPAAGARSRWRSSRRTAMTPCVPMVTAIGPSQPVWVVENAAGGNRAFAPVNQGPGETAWFGRETPRGRRAAAVPCGGRRPAARRCRAGATGRSTCWASPRKACRWATTSTSASRRAPTCCCATSCRTSPPSTTRAGSRSPSSSPATTSSS